LQGGGSCRGNGAQGGHALRADGSAGTCSGTGKVMNERKGF